ncbi:uncharacterized protein LOC135401316 [Ornithodoros turicata]|uniref:uncharacterized protein LOC135401316 n=1 Tax=Ornithodoros turicata TaxID=34597 RepID=UPI003139DD9F
MEQSEDVDFLALPDEIWSRVLICLEPEDLLSIESVSSRFTRLTFDKTILRRVKFRSGHHMDLPDVRRFFRDTRPLAITVLDFTNCVWLPSSLLEQCIGRCLNLVALKIVNCRLSVLSVYKILVRLKSLESLEWSLFSVAQTSVSTIQKLDMRGPLPVCNLRDMYVELLESTVHVDVLLRILPRCKSLRSLHLHVVGTSIVDYTHLPVPNPLGNLDRLEFFTYTTDIVRGRCPYARRSPVIESADLWRIVFGKARELMQTFCVKATVCGNVTMRLKTPHACSCVQLSDILRGVTSCSELKQVCVTVECPTYLVRAAQLEHWEHVQELAFLSPVPIDQPTFPPGIDLSYGHFFLSLLNRCRNLRELNMTRFHFSAGFNCCKVVAESGLRHLAVLALPACALMSSGGPSPLECFSASHLTELDIRRSVPTAHSICSSCSDPHTCVSEDLVPVAKMKSLLRLTLCNLGNVNTLTFLKGCQVQELRISNLGRKGLCPYNNGLADTLRENKRLASIKLDHPVLPLGSRLLWDALSHAVGLRRVCLMSSSHNDVLDRALVFGAINKLAKLTSLHIHTNAVGVKSFNGMLREVLRLSGRESQFRLHVDSADKLDLDPDTIFSSEQSTLCRTSNFVGFAKPRNRDVSDL